MSLLQDYLLQINGALRLPPKEQPAHLAALLSVYPTNQYVVKICNLGTLSAAQVGEAIDRRNWHNGEWPAFELVVKSFVMLCSQMNPWSVLESFDLYSTYLNDVSVAFSNKTRGHLLTPLFKSVVETIIPMAKQLDTQMLLKELHRRPRLTYVAAIVLKGFNHIRSLLGANDHFEAAKKSIMLFLGGRLCLIYFTLCNPLLCQNVFANMNNANLHIATFAQSELMFYRYYLASFYKVKYQFIDAYQHFMWCLHHLPANYSTNSHNATIIMRDLIPLSIMLGKRPNLAAFQQLFYTDASEVPSFFALYATLLHAVRCGSLYQLHHILNDEKNLQFLRKHQLHVIVASKSLILVLRNLLRLVWCISGKPNRLHYDQMGTALRVSLGGLDISAVTTLAQHSNSEDSNTNFNLIVENWLVSLIDQNLLKGKVLARHRVVALAKRDPFPAVDTINFLKFGNGPEGTLAYTDKWMA
ncbi:hypothetical protein METBISCDRAFT_11197 [Metschnikowia bicuspidata]|uniref:PCI domain-containing protein n=1 Tax=Metschnikowia bicuspidata TaxID=27322 RepID=A0A4P9ZLE4_9ASCO|nr:hypothetical protein METBISCDRAFT_11197 [Metschnikowia bicuspidata]